MSDKDIYIEVILPVPVDHGFSYRIEEGTAAGIEASIGQRVLVPFGRRMLVGVISRTGGHKPALETKTIREIIDNKPCLSQPLVKLLQWASGYYFHPVGDVFKQFMPHKDIKLEADKYYALTVQQNDIKGINKKELDAIDYLKHRKSVSRNILINKFGLTTVNSLIKKGALDAVFKPVKKVPRAREILTTAAGADADRDDSSGLPVAGDRESVTLTDEQKSIVTRLTDRFNAGVFDTSLVMGVTGSGKTEIYMRVIEKAVDAGKSAIVLVPEIALTPQLVGRFVRRFGNIVGILHSGIKPAEQKKTQQAILDGTVRVVIGVRAAVFAPLDNVGVIVVDEEHEHTYKQEDRFRYNARDVAIMRAKLENALVILGSATPSLESYYNASTGKYRLYRLYKRIHDLPMPVIRVIDLKEEHPHRIGNEILTKPAVDAITETLARGSQAIIMLNKRGYSSSLVCDDCGHVEKCPECDIPLAYHKATQKLLCHYCGYSSPVLQKCPACGSNSIRPLGIGTQRLEEEIQRIFSDTKYVRMDSDTTGKAGSHGEIINRFGTGEVFMLIGTQMVAKGLDFPDVGLVCLPMLDVGLNVPDFRGAERMFNIITQSAGRAGRGSGGARVLIQTYNPGYYALKYAVEYNTDAFYEAELRNRKELFYPPFSRIALLIFKDKRLDKLRAAMDKVAGVIEALPQSVQASGPVPAPMARVKGMYVYHVLLRSSGSAQLLDTLHRLDGKFKKLIGKIMTVIDVDPQYFV